MHWNIVQYFLNRFFSAANYEKYTYSPHELKKKKKKKKAVVISRRFSRAFERQKSRWIFGILFHI